MAQPSLSTCRGNWTNLMRRCCSRSTTPLPPRSHPATFRSFATVRAPTPLATAPLATRPRRSCSRLRRHSPMLLPPPANASGGRPGTCWRRWFAVAAASATARLSPKARRSSSTSWFSAVRSEITWTELCRRTATWPWSPRPNPTPSPTWRGSTARAPCGAWRRGSWAGRRCGRRAFGHAPHGCLPRSPCRSCTTWRRAALCARWAPPRAWRRTTACGAVRGPGR
mmetsp:Transcript_96828/g.271045  ORF Transcript_96828/g.271045 Transcript_96828/m.271045 type:complete len:225 (+) Transcript_96828:1124-1798(+)